MKTIDEMCAVMQAFKDGKQIEVKTVNSIGRRTPEWIETSSPIWNWDNHDYRVKPEPHYVPYDSVSEIDRSKWVRNKVSPSVLRTINMVDTIKNAVYITGYCWVVIEIFFEEFEYEDGTPCGKLVET